MFKIYKKINKLFDDKQKKKMKFLIVLMVIGSILETFSVGAIVPFISVIMNKEYFLNNDIIASVSNLFSISSSENFILFFTIFIVLLFVIKDLFLVFEERLQLNFVYNNRLRTQQKVLKAFLYKPYEYFLSTNTGEITRMVCDDVNYAYLIITTFFSMLTNLIITFSLIITVMIINTYITLFLIICVGIAIILIYIFIKPKLNIAGSNRMYASSKANMWLYQSVNGIKEIKVTQSEIFFEDSYFKYGKQLINADKKYNIWNNISKRITEMFMIGSLLLMITFLSFRGVRIELILPALSAFGLASVRMLPCVNAISNALNAIAYQEKSLDKLLQLLDELKIPNNDYIYDKKSNDKSYNQMLLKDSIVLNNICYKYPNSNEYVLNNINMYIPVGKSIGIIGESGSGKTTLINILLGLLKPDKGEILVDSKNINDCFSEFLNNIGYIPQDIFLLDETIKDNVMFGKSNSDDNNNLLYSALKKAQIYDFVSRLPDGIYTKVGERGVRLSGGQKQRLGIARALYSNPSILVLDEATSALDIDTEASVMQSINLLHRQKTIIIIAHRLTTIKDCDIIYKIDNGKVVNVDKDELLNINNS